MQKKTPYVNTEMLIHSLELFFGVVQCWKKRNICYFSQLLDFLKSIIIIIIIIHEFHRDASLETKLQGRLILSTLNETLECY